MKLDKCTVVLPCYLDRSHERPLPPKLLLEPRPFEPNASTGENIPPTVWQSAFGPILIEVRDGVAFVNGKRVMSAAELCDSGASG